MNLLHKMLVKQFIPVFITALLFFIMGLELIDLFQNIYSYMNYEVPLLVILKIAALYMPKCISFTVPLALLFAVSFTLGNLYANNELIAVFGSGISLWRFVLPLITIAILFCVGGFFFDDQVVIPTLIEKTQLSSEVLSLNNTSSRSNPTVIDRSNSLIYHADYYNNQAKTFSNLVIIETNSSGDLIKRINSDSAKWDDENNLWEIKKARVFEWDDQGIMWEHFEERISDEKYSTSPISFQKNQREVSEMTLSETREWVETLQASGQIDEYRIAASEYHNRFSYALTPFIVVFISSSIGGRFKKNILLMSLLSSLSIAVVYYVIQMVFLLFGKLGYLSPIVGAWTSFIIISFVGIYLFRIAKT